jgi:hypothetical protein
MISSSSAILTSTPGIAGPTLPKRYRSGVLKLVCVAHADCGLELREDQLIRQLILQAFVAARPLVGLPAHLHGPLYELGLYPRRVFELGRDACMELLPDARHAKEDGWLHFLEVLRHRFDRLGEVHRIAGGDRNVKREHLLGDVRER